MPLSCRYYAQEFPEIEDTVIVNVRSIAEMGAYVSLLEYNNKGEELLVTDNGNGYLRPYVF